MTSLKSTSQVFVALALAGTMFGDVASARDASRPAPPSVQTQPYAIPNPYAPPPPAPTGNRAADAYATGFAIGLGTELMRKQQEDELKRHREQQRK